MFNQLLSPRLLVSAALLALTGCSETVAVRGPVPPPPVAVVYRDRPAPPPIIVEEYRPRRGYVWVRGHWRWNGVRYRWIPGHYRLV